MKKTNLKFAIVSLALFASCSKDISNQKQNAVSATEMAATQAQPSHMMPNEILVKFKPGLPENIKSNLISLVQGNISERLLTAAMKHAGDNEGVYLLHIPGTVIDAVSKLKGLENIIYAEPNFIYSEDATSNDTYYTNGKLWGMYGDATSPVNKYGCQAGEAWAAGHTGSSSVVVGVVDEGAMYAHTDLAANFWTNPFDPVDGIDNDGNGYIDDTHGWDFDGNNNTTYDGTTDDHGTHVSGTIGGKGGNGTGVAGVNWSVTILNAKFLNGSSGSGTTAHAIKAVDYVTDLKTRHSMNIVATNNSWGGGGFSQGLMDAITRAGNADILFVAAAGNNGRNTDVTANYPSCYTNANIISVAAITKTGTKSSFSNYGATTVDLGAPGSAIWSTVPGTGGASSYASYNGTSMATPHVTGAAALYASTHPGSTAAQIKAAILGSAVATPSLAGKCVTGGRLNVSGF